MRQTTYLSLFSGIGGFELGIGERGRCIGFSEIDKFATAVYESQFDHPALGDISKVVAINLPDFDLLVGGFPCQAFSVAGHRLGFADARGGYFFKIAEIIAAKRPRLLLLENVKGLLSHDEGQTFEAIITYLDELGYDCQWQVLNSKNFNVAQNRERVYIAGHLRGTTRPQIFPFQRTSGQAIAQLNKPRHSINRIYAITGVSPTLTTMQGGGRQPFIVLPDGKYRRLTPMECERLQGFPDGWTSQLSDTQRYKTLGNAVTVPIVSAIMDRLLGQRARPATSIPINQHHRSLSTR